MKKSMVIKIGVIVTFSILMFVWGFNFLKGVDIFSEENNYVAVFEKVDDLMVSSPVIMSGYQIGQVRSINFEAGATGNLVVEFSTRQDLQIRKNAIAHIYSKDLMGTKAIQIIQGVSDKYHEGGDTLLASIESDLKDQVEMTMLPLKHKAEDLISSFDSVLTIVTYIFNKSTQDNLSRSFANINKTITKLEHTAQGLDNIVMDQSKNLETIFQNIVAITNTLAQNQERLNTIIANMETVSDTLVSTDFKAMVDNVNKTMADLSAVVAHIKDGNGSVGKLLYTDTLYTNIEAASQNLNILLEDFYKHPKRYIRFSAFDLGKNVYIEDEKDKKKKKNTRKE